jgi:peptidoglycan/xylan/chitin deacetylase (PgdA/CDA1 family)
MLRHLPLAATAALLLACRPAAQVSPTDAADDAAASAPGVLAASFPTDSARRPPNDQRIPILEYHLIGNADTRWGRSVETFRGDLELLHARGYRPITVRQLVRGDYELPPGTRPVVFTFDDASPGQFRYVQRGDSLVVDPTSAVGIWLDMNRRHPDWENRATFCLLSGAKEGHAFFGEKGIDGQLTEWRFRKLRQLDALGFELCAHTLWHANLAKYSDEVVQEQIARSVMAIDSAVPGYRVRSLALPLGIWPRNRDLAVRGAWRDPKSGRRVDYDFDAVLLVAGGPVVPPGSPGFDPRRLTRSQVFGNELVKLLDQLDGKPPVTVASTPPATKKSRAKPVTRKRSS